MCSITGVYRSTIETWKNSVKIFDFVNVGTSLLVIARK